MDPSSRPEPLGDAGTRDLEGRTSLKVDHKQIIRTRWVSILRVRCSITHDLTAAVTMATTLSTERALFLVLGRITFRGPKSTSVLRLFIIRSDKVPRSKTVKSESRVCLGIFERLGRELAEGCPLVGARKGLLLRAELPGSCGS